MKQKSILIADDHCIFAESLANYLSNGFEVIKIVHDGCELIKSAEIYRPDIVITDISMPNLNGIEATKNIKKLNSKILVLILTQHTDIVYASKSIEAGANGVAIKSCTSTELHYALKEIISGKTYVSPIISGDLINFMNYNGPGKQIPKSLTARQNEILNYLAEGLTAKEIANNLNISPRTVEHHKYCIMRLLNCKTTAALVKYSIENRLV